MTRRIKLVVSALLFVAVVMSAATDRNLTVEKGHRFFDNKEWASASAMFMLVIAEHEADADIFAHAIVAAAMQGDTPEQTRLLNEALQRSMAFDSVMTQVHAISLKAGCTEAYERFLLLSREAYPWLARAVDRYLLRYYVWRHDGPMMVRYSEALLRGLPGDPGYMSTLALGYLYSNDEERAMKVYADILEADPRNFEALTALGINAASAGRTQAAKEWLGRAYALRPTPYIASLLKNL